MKKMKLNHIDGDALISKIPKELILMIISLLPFKQAAKTSVLSKMWRNLWRDTQNVELYENYFIKPNEESEENKSKHRRKFIDFSKKWCGSYPKQNIITFRLVFSNPEDYIEDLQELVKFAIDHKVKVLELDFSAPTWDENEITKEDPIFELPEFAYKHQGLVSIKLYSCKVRVSHFKNRGEIKNLSLGWTNLSLNNLSRFIGKCQFLESLSLKKCWNIGRLNVRAPTLKALVLDKCLDLDGVYINAENVKYFKYSGELIRFLFEYDFSTLEVAEVDFDEEDALRENCDYIMFNSDNIMYNLLDNLWSCKVLTVCSYLLQVIPSSKEYPSLECVRHLILKTGLHKHEYYGITFLLKCCEDLETLTFDMRQPLIFEELATDIPIEEHPFLIGSNDAYFDAYDEPPFECMKTLKTVEIKGFKGDIYETKAIEYLITYGTSLEKVCISLSKEKVVYGVDMSSTYRLMAECLIMMCPIRASPNLEFVIED